MTATTRPKPKTSQPQVTRHVLPTLGVKEVCDIIAAAAQHKVSSLSFAGLSLTFGDKSPTSSSTELTPPQVKIVPLAGKVPTEEELSRVERAEAIEQQLEQLKVEDPAEFERMLINGEVEG